MNQATDPTIRSAARWFWWIAGLSLVNAVMFFSGSDTSFVVGLAMTTVASVVFKSVPLVAWVLVAVTVGFYFAMGHFAQQRRLWAFYLGLAVYAVDALICLAVQDWMSAGFHALAGYFIYKGVSQIRRGPVLAEA